MFAIFVKVVAPEDMRICLILFSNAFMASSSTLRKACAVLSFVTSFVRLHTPSFAANPSWAILQRGKILTSKPDMLNRRFGLSLLYTLTRLFSHSKVVMLLGSLFFISQNTARPRFTSCFISLILASLGQHFLLL